MRGKMMCLALMLVLAPLARVVQAQSTDDQTAKVKSEIAKRVANKKTKVKIKLRSGEELKGRIDQSDDSRFTLAEDKTGKQIQLSYSEVEAVKGRGGLGTGAKIGIIAAVVVVGVAVAAVISVKNIDPFQGGITAR